MLKNSQLYNIGLGIFPKRNRIKMKWVDETNVFVILLFFTHALGMLANKAFENNVISI